MNSPTPISPALQLLTWPLQLAQLSAQAFQAERRLARIAADLELLQRTDEPAYHQLRLTCATWSGTSRPRRFAISALRGAAGNQFCYALPISQWARKTTG